MPGPVQWKRFNGQVIVGLVAIAILNSGCQPSSALQQKEAPVPPISHNSSATPAPISAPAKKSSSVPFRFRDATSDWGLSFTRFDDMRGDNRIQELLGGGVALVDFDLDGSLDLFMVQGCRLPLREKTNEYTNEMYRNRGRFEKVTEVAGLVAHGYYSGCEAGDYDEDGFPDLFLSAYGSSGLWRNNGDGTFQAVADGGGLARESWTTSSAWADFNGDGLLDLFAATYAKANDDPPMICKEPRSPTGTKSCSPILFPALDDFLFVNDGHGSFAEVTRSAGITGLDGRGQGTVACDLTGDGWCDIFVANDTTPSFLYVNQTGKNEKTQISGRELLLPQFEERGIEFGVALNADGKATAAMGVGHGDYDGDGWPDLFITNFFLETNTLFRNLGGAAFADVSNSSRLGPPSRNTLAFGTEFLDVDHDGWLDLVVPTGHIEDRPWSKNEPYRMRPHLFRNDRNGRFTEVSSEAGSYFTSEWIGRGLATGDVDRDGDLDFVVGNQIDPSLLVLNETPASGSSVVIKPVGRLRSPRCGIGTRVIATGVIPQVLARDIAGGGSFLSTCAQELHCGLGDKKSIAEIQLLWPDGQVDRWSNVQAGYYVAIEGGQLFRIHFPAE
ncbi:MAG: hypothetical protein JWP89_3971 [Schlesneria sp.]|nr:hypothetical protein [Schlesneria sp.]